MNSGKYRFPVLVIAVIAALCVLFAVCGAAADGAGDPYLKQVRQDEEFLNRLQGGPTRGAGGYIDTTGAHIRIDTVSAPALGGTAVWSVSFTGTATNVSASLCMQDFSEDYTTVYEDRNPGSTVSCGIVTAGNYEFVVFANVGGEDWCRVVQFTVEDDDAHTSLTEKVGEVVSGCPGTSDWDDALYLHDWLTHNAYYDLSYSYYGADGVLLRGTGVCDSYSKAYMMLCEEAGFPVTRVIGTAGGDGHSWNAIQLDGEWYLVDVTWDDPVSEDVAVSGDENHDYFCLTDELMGLDHFGAEPESPIGQCSSPDANWQLRTGDLNGMGNTIVYFSGQYISGLSSYSELIAEQLESGESSFTVACEDTIYQRVTNDGGHYGWSESAAGSATATREWRLLALYLSRTPFTLNDGTTANVAVTFDEQQNLFSCERVDSLAWQELQAQIDSGESPVTCTLTDDVTAYENDTALVIPAGKTVIIDLNGYTLDRNHLEEPIYTGNAISVESGASLTIRDGSAGETGRITGAYNTTTEGCVVNYGTLTLEGGSITGNYITGVNNYGTFNMTGGSVSGNDTASNRVGIAVHNQENAEMTMSGGSISDNTKYGIWNYGTLTVSGGTIYGNPSGGLSAHSGSFTVISGGTISGNGNVLSSGGGVSVYDAEVTISGGSIEGNYGNTAVLSNGSKASLTLSGGSISGNHAGGVWIMGGAFTLEDGVTFGNNVCETDFYSCDIALGSGCRINLTEPLNLTEPILVRTADSPQPDEPIVVTEGYLDDSGIPRVRAGMITDKGNTEDTPHYKVIVDGELAFSLEETFTSDDEWKAVQTQIDEGESPVSIQLTMNTAALPSTDPLVIPAGKTVTIDLNGYTLDRNCLKAASNSGNAIYIQSGGSLTIRDGSAAKTGKITGAYNTVTRGGIVNYGTLTLESGSITGNYLTGVNNYGTFNMTGGNVSENGGAPPKENGQSEVEVAVENRGNAQMTMSGGNVSDNTGSGIWSTGTLTISGGTISGNPSGGLNALQGSVTLMTGGTISGNGTALSSGDGVSVYDAEMTISGGSIEGNYGNTAVLSNGSKASLTLSGGSISGNHAGGVWIMGGAFTLEDGVTFGNNVCETDFYSCDIALGSGCRITLTEPLNLTEPIVVRSTDVLQAVNPIVITEGYTDGSGNPRVSADMITDKGNTATSPRYKIVVHKELAFSLEETYVSGEEWAALQEEINEGESPVSIQLAADTTALPSSSPLVIPAGKAVTIDLNGYKLDRNCLNSPGYTAYAIEVEQGASLTINDSSEAGTGTITGANAENRGCVINRGTLVFNGGCIDGNYENGVENHGEFTMNSGTISGNGHTEPAQYYSPELAVYNYAGATMVMNGGSISDNMAHGVWNYGTFTFNEGTISDNTGTGVKVHKNAGMTMKGGCISGNGMANLAMSGGMMNSGTVTIEAGEITGNKGSETISNDGTLIIKGGRIRNNLTGGIRNSQMIGAGQLYLAGSPVFGNNVLTTQQSDGSTSTQTWDVYLMNNSTIQFAGDLAPEVSVTVDVRGSAAGGKVVTEGLTAEDGHLMASPVSFKCKENNITLMRDGELALAVPSMLAMDTPDFILPESIREIGEEAFAGTGAKAVRIPYGAEKIESGAFADMTLEEIYIPETVTDIAEDAFNPDYVLVIFGKWKSPAYNYANSHENMSFISVSN